ncbi:MAG: DUF4340 domain-containing protein [Polyangiaceae bacterium]
MRRHLASGLIIALAVGATAYAYFGDRGSVSDLERERRAHLLFPAFRRDEIQSIELLHGSEKIRFEGQNDDAGDRAWHMTSPVGDKGDTSAIDRLIGALEYASYERKVPSGGLGFESPRVRGSIAMNKVTYHFEVGASATPPDGAAYFKLDGEGAFVIKADLVNELLKSADAFRDRSVVPYLSIDLQRFEVAAKEPWAIERMDDISFRIVSPSGNFQGVRASRSGIDRVWGALAEMRAESFPAADEAARALSPPLFTITMTPKDSSLPPAELALGTACSAAPDDILLERRSPTRLLACVPKGALAGIATPLIELADRHPFAAIAEEVVQLTLETIATGSKIELARKGDGWHERTPTDRDLVGEQGEMATGLAKALVSSEGELLNSPRRPFLPTYRVQITRAESNVLETVEVSGDVVHRLADDRFVVLSPTVRHRFEPHASAFRASTIWPTGLDNMRVEQLTNDCAGVKQIVVRDAQSHFHFQTPEHVAVDPGRVIALAEAIERARATSWVADTDDGSFSLNPGCSVSIAGQGDAGDRHAKITFGGDAGNGDVFARANDDPAVFTLSRALVDLAKGLLIDRSGFFVDADSIDAVDISRGEKRVHFALSAGADAGPSGEAVAAAVGELQADSVLHLGAAKSEEGFASPVDVRVHSTGDGGARILHFVLGATIAAGEQKMIYGRVDGVDATFLLPETRVRPLLDAFENRGP